MNNNHFKLLSDKGIRPSIQRTAVYEYLYDHPIHPTVETVYSALHPEYPTLSKTTVYNTLKLLADNGLVQALQIEEDKVRFDANVEPHLHFKCSKCGKIIDIQAKDTISKCNSELSNLLPPGYVSKTIQTYIWGLCDNCSDNK